MTDQTQRRDGSDRRSPLGGAALPELMRAARAQLAELTGLRPETVTRFERTEDGWVLEAEVLELARVPDTMSLMGLYELVLDEEGVLTGYRRIDRYERAKGSGQT
ncbi:gas vesicle protein [Streptomyces sp. Ru73]|uniref:gas vesicle protein GvpO n=1 Tax=Streptomyces sp. Ru73 TaxID=2080748 RepID=UPI000CDE00D4|nr:gas vesicle protein [Streptomyces sp. Ru73]POX39337.1 gas vesicle protein [Streptomyces sp. Ru73]